MPHTTKVISKKQNDSINPSYFLIYNYPIYKFDDYIYCLFYTHVSVVELVKTCNIILAEIIMITGKKLYLS